MGVKIYDRSLSLLRDAIESQRKMVRMGQWSIWVISRKLEVGRGQREFCPCGEMKEQYNCTMTAWA